MPTSKVVPSQALTPPVAGIASDRDELRCRFRTEKRHGKNADDNNCFILNRRSNYSIEKDKLAPQRFMSTQH
jgi:hypothetical protein